MSEDTESGVPNKSDEPFLLGPTTQQQLHWGVHEDRHIHLHTQTHREAPDPEPTLTPPDLTPTLILNRP